MSLDMCHLLLILKNLLENALKFVTRCRLEYFAMLSRFHSRGRTHDAGSVTRMAFKYKLTGFRINIFKNDLSVHSFCVCLFITVGQSTVPRQLHKNHLSKITANNYFQF